MNTPYYAVIFTSTLTNTADGYEQMAQKMEDLAKQQEGFLGMESAREGVGITVSYWKNMEAIAAWKNHNDHIFAQSMGKQKWYSSYTVRICKVVRSYDFCKD